MTELCPAGLLYVRLRSSSGSVCTCDTDVRYEQAWLGPFIFFPVFLQLGGVLAELIAYEQASELSLNALWENSGSSVMIAV